MLDEIAILSRREGKHVPIKDLELCLASRGFGDAQTRRALMSLLRRGQVELAGAQRVACKTFDKGQTGGQNGSGSRPASL
ncbi:MAG: hypothetical protein ACKOEC_04385 [Acidimicrobiia bacterium]